MGRRTLRTGTRCTIGVAFALGVAGLMPAPASSETGPDASLSAVTSPADAAAAIESALADASAATVAEDVVASVLDESIPTPVPAPEETDDAVESGTDSEPAAALPPPEPAPEPVDTTAESADTTSDTPAAPPESAMHAEPRASTAPPTGVAQVLAGNITVSVRIASPGDNDPVTQTNVTTTSSAGPAVAAPASSHEAGERPTVVETGRLAPTVSPKGSPSASPAETTEGTWTWDWDCLSVPSFSGMSPGGFDGGITPGNWIWNWNCGDNAPQYQSGSTEQYHPINVNVGIRISSSGNDGPVSQANVVVAIGAGIVVPPAFPPPTAPTDATPVAVPAPVEAGVPEGTMSSGSDVAITNAALGLVVLEPADEPVAAIHGTSRPGGVFPSLGPAAIGIAHPVVPGLARSGGLRTLPATALQPWSMPGSLRAGGGRHAQPSPGRAAVEKAAPRWTRSRGIRGSITPQSSGTSVAPAGAGSSSSGGLPFILALPFLVAVLDMARRRVLDRVATPSGHRSRVPDDPG